MPKHFTAWNLVAGVLNQRRTTLLYDPGGTGKSLST